MAADESTGSETPVFAAGDSGFSADEDNSTEIDFAGIPAEIEVLAAPEIDAIGTSPADSVFDGSAGSVSSGMLPEIETLAPAGIDAKELLPSDVNFDDTTDSVFSRKAGVIDALIATEVLSDTSGLGITKLDGSVVFDVSEADKSLLDLVALFSSSDVNGLDTDPVGSGITGRLVIIPLVLAALSSEEPVAEVVVVILLGSGLSKFLLLVAAAVSLSKTSFEGTLVILGPAGR